MDKKLKIGNIKANKETPVKPGQTEKRLLLVLLYVSHVLGCKNPSGIEERPEFFPLKIGNSWSYALTPWMTPNADSIITESVVADTSINNEKWFLLSIPLGDRRTRGDYYRNRSDGLWTMHPQTFSKPRLVYKYPAVANELYIATPGDTIVVAGTNESVVVPAGTFNCIAYQRKIVIGTDSTQAFVFHNTYISPGVGKVKEELFNRDQEGQKIVVGQYVLVGYSIK